MKQNSIRHTKIKPRTPQSNGIVEGFNRTLLEEFYQIAMMKKVYSSISGLQDGLDKFIFYYNFKRTNQGYRLKGKIPYQKFFNGMRKYALPGPYNIVLFSMGKSRKCKHHLKVIQLNRFPRLYRRGTFKTQALLVLFLPLLVIGRIFGLLLRLFLP